MHLKFSTQNARKKNTKVTVTDWLVLLLIESQEDPMHEQPQEDASAAKAISKLSEITTVELATQLVIRARHLVYKGCEKSEPWVCSKQTSRRYECNPLAKRIDIDGVEDDETLGCFGAKKHTRPQFQSKS